LGQFRGQKSLGPLEISLEMAHYVVCPQKKIISLIFKISGALIVKSIPCVLFICNIVSWFILAT
jgi:hypothetical protein